MQTNTSIKRVGVCVLPGAVRKGQLQLIQKFTIQTPQMWIGNVAFHKSMYLRRVKHFYFPHIDFGFMEWQW